MTGDHVGTFEHGGEEWAQVLAFDLVDPATPGTQFTPRYVRVGEEIDLGHAANDRRLDALAR